MQKILLFKILAILALTLLICVPMSMIEHTVRERSNFRDQAVASVSAESVREQTVIGPVMVIHYADDYEERVLNDKTGMKDSVPRTVARRLFVFPNSLMVTGVIDTSRRYRGIHQVLMYNGQYGLSGDFSVPALASFPRQGSGSRLRIGKVQVSVGVSDVRGIQDIPKIDIDGRQVEFQQGAALNSMSSGLHADLGAIALGAQLDKAGPDQATVLKFAFHLGLDGIERHHFSPVGKNNKFTLQSNWPHPQFGGLFLPNMQGAKATEKGFTRSWHISALATNAQRQLLGLEGSEGDGDRALSRMDRFSVGFIEPINVYSMSERAVKYGLLFVGLTFAAFFVFEILKRLPIHPVQYLLVGLALVLFFLLLLSLSEKFDFLLAYLVASGACIVLIGFYLSYVLRNWWRGIVFGVGLTMLYAALYGLLVSENNALVMGSVLLFAVLAAVMVATRKVDWYQVGKGEMAAV